MIASIDVFQIKSKLIIHHGTYWNLRFEYDTQEDYLILFDDESGGLQCLHCYMLNQPEDLIENMLDLDK